MYRIGIDVGSTYTKYCIMRDKQIIDLRAEVTPLRQKTYFDEKVRELREQYPDSVIVSCGYGKSNVDSIKSINELTALAKGSYYLLNQNGCILDIGGQDTKLIIQEEGKLKRFFLNDKCAAGSGMFLTTVLNRLGRTFESIDLTGVEEPSFHLSSVCAIFAQSEIVELIADNRTEDEIIQAVIWQIFAKTKPLLVKVEEGSILLSGGLSIIPGVNAFASRALDRGCYTLDDCNFIAAVGCSITI